MKYGDCTFVEGYPNGSAIAFHSKIGGRSVAVVVSSDTFKKIAAALEHTDHIGHACWHVSNPDARMPCLSCEKAPT